MLKTVVLHNILWKLVINLFVRIHRLNRKFKRTAFIFTLSYKCLYCHFDQFNASLINKIVHKKSCWVAVVCKRDPMMSFRALYEVIVEHFCHNLHFHSKQRSSLIGGFED